MTTRTAGPDAPTGAAAPKVGDKQGRAGCRSRGGVRRSIELFRDFRVEQSDPARFYGALAKDSVEMVGSYMCLREARVLDVGGGPGWMAEAFELAGARCTVVERHLSELPMGSWRPSVRGLLADGAALPLRSASIDLCFCSNVLEHVPDPWAVLEEMVRVTRPGGVLFVAFTNWLSPWGGHETSPWHYLGGQRAALRFERRHARPPKNLYGASLFPLHVAQVLAWAKKHPGAQLVDARPRYYPGWCRPLLMVPGLREVLTWNLVTVLRRR